MTSTSFADSHGSAIASVSERRGDGDADADEAAAASFAPTTRRRSGVMRNVDVAVLWRNSPAIMQDADEQHDHAAADAEPNDVADAFAAVERELPSLAGAGAGMARATLTGTNASAAADVDQNDAGRAQLQQLRADQVVSSHGLLRGRELEEHLLEVELLRRSSRR